MQEIIYKELLEIADKKGIEVIERNFNSSIKGLYGQDGDIQVIALSKNLKDQKEINFTLAHELGHAELHKGNIDKVLYFNDSDYTNKLEDEANNYANTLISYLIVEGGNILKDDKGNIRI